MNADKAGAAMLTDAEDLAVLLHRLRVVEDGVVRGYNNDRVLRMGSDVVERRVRQRATHVEVPLAEGGCVRRCGWNVVQSDDLHDTFDSLQDTCG